MHEYKNTTRMIDILRQNETPIRFGKLDYIYMNSLKYVAVFLGGMTVAGVIFNAI